MLRALLVGLVLCVATAAAADEAVLVVTRSMIDSAFAGAAVNPEDFDKWLVSGEEGKRVLVVVNSKTGDWFRITVEAGEGPPPAVGIPVQPVAPPVKVQPVPNPPTGEAKVQPVPNPPADEVQALPVPPTPPPARPKCACCDDAMAALTARLDALERRIDSVPRGTGYPAGGGIFEKSTARALRRLAQSR